MSKVLVFCIDALCLSDVEEMKNMPHFGPFLKDAAVVGIEPIFPAVTYPCHTSILTGCTVKKHGIVSCEKIYRGGYFDMPWYREKEEVLVPTLLDLAREQGLTTCSLAWPVSGGADYDLNMPMYVPYEYTGWEPEKYLEGKASAELMDRYFYKHGRYIKGPDRSLDLLTMALALDILEDYPQPDIMLVKMCDLDGYRHELGVHHPRVSEQLRKHDQEFGSLLEALRRKGTLEDTNIIILGDHGMTDYQDICHLNVLLRKNGFIRVNEEGKIESFDALIHSCGLAAYVEMANPEDREMHEKVRAFLESLKDDPEIMLDYVLDKEEADRLFGVDAFEFYIESKLPISFGNEYAPDSIWGSQQGLRDRNYGGDHGGSPKREEITVFLAKGPNVRPVHLQHRHSMVDEAPTMARMLGFTMEDVDGTAIEEILV